MTDIAILKSNLAKYEQGHLLQFWNDLSESERNLLMEDLVKLNLEEAVCYYERATESLNDSVKKLDDQMKPMPSSQCGSLLETSQEELDKYQQVGLDKISNNEVGVLLMAGGQGTRLGVSYPKGMYSVGLLSGKTLFRLQAERIKQLEKIALLKTGKEGFITWYIMTSEHTMEPTKKYFLDNNYFGLDSRNIVMFEQGKNPCYDFKGKILLNKKYQVSQSPDGNGGLYKALRDKQILEDMACRNVKYLHAHSVDNILVQPADPIFIGYCIEKKADCAAKVVKKSSPTEAVGVVCMVNDKVQVVEYSEINQTTAELTNAKGELVFNAGNICNHFFTADFLRNVAANYEPLLKLHVAKKKIPYVNDNGELVKPTELNGIKVEKFIFDVFPFSKNFVTWEVPRNVEFSALKNADDAGKDCPSTARRDLYALHKSYIEAAGGTVDGDVIEISPLLTYNGEGLIALVNNKNYKAPVLLE